MNRIITFIVCVFCALCVCQCMGSRVAGGTSEETNAIVLHNINTVPGYDDESYAMEFSSAKSYALSFILGKKFSEATSFEISAWVKIDSLPQKSDKPYNVVGKFVSDKDSLPSEFSLAIVNGACNSKHPTFAFFLTDKSMSFNCEQALLSTRPVQQGLWTFVQVVWDGRHITLSQNKNVVAREERGLSILPISKTPVYLGKTGMQFVIDKISLNAEGL